jgi:GGDEF domain-containing protein
MHTMQPSDTPAMTTPRLLRPHVRQPSPKAVLLIALALAAALLLAAQSYDTAAAAVAATAFTVIAIEMLRIGLWDTRTSPSVIARILTQAQTGRRLAIYDRETGLFAHWYLTLRGQEECARAARYERQIALILIEAAVADRAAALNARPVIARWLQTELRSTDIAGYVGNGRFVVLAPEGDLAASVRLLDRLRDSAGAIDTGVATFPDDGLTYEQLWRRASRRLPRVEPLAA